MKTSEQATADKSKELNVGGQPDGVTGKAKKSAKNPVKANQQAPDYNPDVPEQINTHSVNPVAPLVYPKEGDHVVRQTATPDAKDEPTWNK